MSKLDRNGQVRKIVTPQGLSRGGFTYILKRIKDNLNRCLKTGESEHPYIYSIESVEKKEKAYYISYSLFL